MTTSIPEPTGGGGVVEGPDRPDERPAPGAGTEQPWSWHLNRASALLLVILVPVQFAVTFLVDDIGTTTARTMSERLDDPTWRLLTWLTIALALLHAVLGTNRRLRDRESTGAVAAITTIGVLAGALLAAASWALISPGA